jgi:hypothetical protein
MQRPYKDSGPLPLSSEHSTKELEHRLTRLEDAKAMHGEHSEELFQIVERHSDKLTLHEKAILGILGALSILLQDKFPKIAALIKGIL